jgi:hypothetical protein
LGRAALMRMTGVCSMPLLARSLTLARFWGVEEEKDAILIRGGRHGQNATNVYQRIQAASSKVI